MSIEEVEKIDIISMKDGAPFLSITDHMPWDGIEHIYLLQEKINSYLEFVLSGQLYKEYPSAVGANPTIRLIYKYEPRKNDFEFLEKIESFLRSQGIVFVLEKFSGDLVDKD